MAQLLVRNLDEDVKVRLRILAAGHGRSVEEEVRAILRQAVVKSEPGSSFCPPAAAKPICLLISSGSWKRIFEAASRHSIVTRPAPPRPSRRPDAGWVARGRYATA